MESTSSDYSAVLNPAASPGHRWLNRLVGEWKATHESNAGDEAPHPPWTERVRQIGDLWIVAESDGEMPDGTPSSTMMTLGYDPVGDRYIGTWVGSMMTHMWIYDGRLDESGMILTLNTEGPDFEQPEKRKLYRDIVEFVSDDERLLRGQVQGENGEWTEFMTARFKRVR